MVHEQKYDISDLQLILFYCGNNPGSKNLMGYLADDVVTLIKAIDDWPGQTRHYKKC